MTMLLVQDNLKVVHSAAKRRTMTCVVDVWVQGSKGSERYREQLCMMDARPLT